MSNVVENIIEAEPMAKPVKQLIQTAIPMQEAADLLLSPSFADQPAKTTGILKFR